MSGRGGAGGCPGTCGGAAAGDRGVLAGWRVGKTSVVATLGRALAALGERMLLVDTASFGLLPFFFGARDQRPGVCGRSARGTVRMRRCS